VRIWFVGFVGLFLKTDLSQVKKYFENYEFYLNEQKPLEQSLLGTMFESG
jgi:hypothetical protein